MNYQIELLNKQITETNEAKDKACEPFDQTLRQLHEKLSLEWTELFSKDTELNQAFSDLENSTNYGLDQDELYSWVSFIPSKDYDSDELDNYIADLGYHWDKVYDCLTMFHGDDFIWINDDGEVGQYHKTWFTKSDYDTEEERNKLIEQHMKREGFFPGVFYIDHYGDVSHVNTRSTDNE